MALNLGPLKAVVDDLVRAAENVGADLVNQESGIAQEDLDGLTNALQGVHSKIAPAAAPAATDAGAPPAGAPPAAPAGDVAPPPAAEGAGSAGTGVQLPPLNTGS